jgi:hypothetical protein
VVLVETTGEVVTEVGPPLLLLDTAMAMAAAATPTPMMIMVVPLSHRCAW